MINDEVGNQSYRDRIILAATKCFGEKGVQKTTLKELARESGVAVDEIRAIFRNKNLIAYEVQTRELEKIKETYLTDMPEGTCDETIKHVLLTRLKFVEEHEEQTMQFFIRALLGRQPWSAALDRMIWQLSIEFAALLEKAIRDGYIKKDTDVNLSVRAIVSFYLTGVVTIGLRSNEFNIAAVWDFIEPQIDFVFHHIKNK